MESKKLREKVLVSLNIFLQLLGHSLYGVFIPIFLLKEGATLPEVFIYGAMDGLGTLGGALVGPAAVKKFGVKFPLVFRALFQPLWVVGLLNHGKLPFPLPAYGFVFGAFTSVYWLAINAYTIEASSKKERGLFSGISSAMVWIASIIAPLIGAFIIGKFGYSAVFSLAIAVILLALVPALLLPRLRLLDGAQTRTIPKKGGGTGRRNEILGAFLLMYAILGVGGLATYYAWPLYLYSVFGGELQIGLLASLGSFFGLAGALFGGWFADKMSKTRLVAASGSVLFFSWVLSAAFTSALALSIVVSFRRFADEVTGNALFAKFGNLFARDNLIIRIAQKHFALGAGLALAGALACFVSIRTFFVLVGILFLVYAAAISGTVFRTGRKLALPRGMLIFLERFYQN
ncbi:MAG: MFS transporter [archaeon]